MNSANAFAGLVIGAPRKRSLLRVWGCWHPTSTDQSAVHPQTIRHVDSRSSACDVELRRVIPYLAGRVFTTHNALVLSGNEHRPILRRHEASLAGTSFRDLRRYGWTVEIRPSPLFAPSRCAQTHPFVRSWVSISPLFLSSVPRCLISLF